MATSPGNPVPPPTPARRPWFATTHWSVVLSARTEDPARELVREAIAHTVSQPVEIDAELRHLFQVLGG